MEKGNDVGLLIIRTAIGVLMLFHGIAKLKGLGHIEAMVTNAGLMSFLAYGVYITEIVAPIFILLGWKIRIWALIYFFGMITALYLAHSKDLFALSKTGGLKIELILLYALGSLALVFTGSGKYAISRGGKFD